MERSFLISLVEIGWKNWNSQKIIYFFQLKFQKFQLKIIKERKLRIKKGNLLKPQKPLNFAADKQIFLEKYINKKYVIKVLALV